VRRGVILLLLPWVLAAATPVPPESLRAEFRAETRLVVLSATAVDRKGRPVRDLRADEVQVFEGGRLQKILHFGQARATRARLLLLVDASGSMEGSTQQARVFATAEQILLTLEPEDEVALAAFDDHDFGVVAFTRDRDAIRRGLRGLTAFGTTALNDALDHAAIDLASHGEGRRAVVVVTDGVDNRSRMQPDEVIAHSRALDVPIYALALVSPVDDPGSSAFLGTRGGASASVTGERVLKRYAELSGGAAFTVSGAQTQREAALRIVEELKHQYRLGYDAPEGPSGFRRIELRTTRKGVRMKTRSGYVPPS